MTPSHCQYMITHRFHRIVRINTPFIYTAIYSAAYVHHIAEPRLRLKLSLFQIQAIQTTNLGICTVASSLKSIRTPRVVLSHITAGCWLTFFHLKKDDQLKILT